MARLDFPKLITRLHQAEISSMERIRPAQFLASDDPRETFRAASNFSRPYLTHEVRTFDSGQFTEWGQYAYTRAGEVQIKLPQMLFLYPSVIVDLTTHSETDFIDTFGVTPSQFKMLAKEGFVLPNVAYDSNFLDLDGELWPDHRLRSTSDYNFCPHVLDFIADPEVPVTINAVRRRKLFADLGISESDQLSAVRRYARRLLSAIDSDDSSVLAIKYSGMPAKDQKGMIARLANNLMYLEKLGALFGNEADVAFVLDFDNDPTGFDTEELITYITHRKADACAQISATFGGAQTVTAPQLARIHGAREYIDRLTGVETRKAQDPAVISEQDISFNDVLLEIAEMHRQSDVMITPAMSRLPISSDAEFEGFLSFLKDIHSYHRQVETLKRALTGLGTLEDASKAIKRFYKLRDEMLTEAARSTTWFENFGVAIVGTLTGLAVSDRLKSQPTISAFAQGEWPGEKASGIDRRTFLCLAAGIPTTAAINASVPSVLGPLIDQRKPEAGTYRQLVLENMRAIAQT